MRRARAHASITRAAAHANACVGGTSEGARPAITASTTSTTTPTRVIQHENNTQTDMQNNVKDMQTTQTTRKQHKNKMQNNTNSMQTTHKKHANKQHAKQHLKDMQTTQKTCKQHDNKMQNMQNNANTKTCK